MSFSNVDYILRSYRARLQPTHASGIPLNLSVFRRGTGGALGDLIASTGSYSDNISGVLLPSTYLEPGIYLMIPSTYSSGVCAGFEVAIYSDNSLELVPVPV